MKIKLGTRSSKLALWQANEVRRRLEMSGHQVEIVEISTAGDQRLTIPLHQMQVVGIFTRTLDEALISGKIDLAVHSAKDIPSALPEPLTIAAYLKREDPRDALLALSPDVHLENLARQITVGTSSLRRKALLLHYFNHVEVVPVRGNVDTRIALLEAGKCDALMLAYAGVKRMGLERYVVQKMNVSGFVPAVGQGAIALMTRKGDAIQEVVRPILNHAETEIAVRSERAFLYKMAGGCQTPIFGFATVLGNQLTLKGGIADESGAFVNQDTLEGTIEEADQLGHALASRVLGQAA